MPRAHGPLFDKLLPRRGLQRFTDDKIRALLLKHSVVSTTHSYEGVPCREWQRALRSGYGRMWNGQQLAGANIEAFKVFRGPIPEGHDVCHHCDNPPCIEGSHLWTGTHADNMADRDRKGRNGGHKNRGHNRPNKSRGTKHPKAKLTEAQAKKILALGKALPEDLPRHLRKKSGALNSAALSRDLGVSESLVYGVLGGRNWAWIK